MSATENRTIIETFSCSSLFNVQYIFTYMSSSLICPGLAIRCAIKKFIYMSWFWGGEAAPEIHLYVLVWRIFLQRGGWGGEAALKCL